jgi:DNA-binding NarL/FixJ family response regulator
VTLIGRSQECQALDALLESARDGLSGTLVLRGEPGIGKSALLDYAVENASDFLVVRFSGVESESQLAFAALHRLLQPILHQVKRLPAPQREAMDSAMGLAVGPPANRFLVGLATINLAANAARARKRLLTIVDDAQWVDRESLEALAFWGRRLHVDRIALIFGERTASESQTLLDDFEVMQLSGLSDVDALELLTREARRPLDRDVATRIVAETEGNPLALMESARDSALDDLVGAAAVPQPLPISRKLEERFLRQVRALPAGSQMFLLLVAADSSAGSGLVWDAAAVLGVDREAAKVAEAAGLIVLGSRITYRHPLIRSAVYGGARPADRRAVHGALAAATDAEVEPDRRAWHLAAAAVGPDDGVADLLEHRAQTAHERGGYSAEVALLSRSAELTSTPHRAGERRVQAAEAALSAGSPRQAHHLVSLATESLRDPSIQARAERVDGIASLHEGQVAEAAPRLLSASVRLLAMDGALGRRTLLDAVQAANYGGYRADNEFLQAVAHAVPSLTGKSVVDLLLNAFATNASAGYVEAVPVYQLAVRAMSEDVSPRELVPWVTLVSASAWNVWDNDGHDALCRRVAAASRDDGALVPLATALVYSAYGEMWAGRFESARALFVEADDIYRAAGEHFLPQMDLELNALRGEDADVHEKAEFAITLKETMGLGGYANAARMAIVVLELGRSRYEVALRHALALFAADPLQALPHALSDLVEAATRAGDRRAAELGLRRLAERAQAAGTPWALGLLARSQALIAGDEGEPQYRAAIEKLGAADMYIERARTQLVFGEWLRRQKRRNDAREHLRDAYEGFAAAGAEAFANRAREELMATGERARRRSVETTNDLTSQESRIAELAAGGATNTEIAAQLFIAVSTVEYHLRKVFRKLEVTSRRQLKPRMLAPAADTPTRSDGTR